VATDHDSIDHGYAAKAHPSIHLDSARLSWQNSLNCKPPATWKVCVVGVLVLVALLALNRLQAWRVEVHMTHMREEIRQNIVTLATAALQYMNAHHVTSVNESQLVGPGALLKVPPDPIIGESYDKLVFSQADPSVVEIHVPRAPNIFFHIRWDHPEAPNFVSPPVVEQSRTGN
jgi:hypothetical protein